MGLEFREGSLALSGKNETRERKGMVFIVAIGLDQLEAKKASDSRASKYSLFISDTVVVGENAAEVLTDRAQKQWTDVSYYVKDGAEGDAGDEGGSSSRGRGNVESLESRTRGKNVSAKHIETNDMLANHQVSLSPHLPQLSHPMFPMHHPIHLANSTPRPSSRRRCASKHWSGSPTRT